MFGALSGLVAGLVGSGVMEGFQALWLKAKERLGADETGGSAAPGPPVKLAALAVEGGASPPDPAPVKVAAAVTASLTGGRLRKAEKEPAGRIVHYAFGTASAIGYGVLADLAPIVTLGFGTLFGIAVWILLDNLMLWALGLAKRPTAYPLSAHAYALASHVVYGAAVEAVRQLVRPLFPS